jgi:hypothetical protein
MCMFIPSIHRKMILRIRKYNLKKLLLNLLTSSKEHTGETVDWLVIQNCDGTFSIIETGAFAKIPSGLFLWEQCLKKEDCQMIQMNMGAAFQNALETDKAIFLAYYGE